MTSGKANPLLRWAHFYGGHGLAVFPCKPRGKEPLTVHGFKDASTDPKVIAGWWTESSDANIGMRTGKISGVLAIDIDPRNGGEDSWGELRSNRKIPRTAKQITGGGGRHIIFRYPGISVPKTLAPGIDLKGEGGYILVPPSIHPTGNPYRWEGISRVKALLDPAEVPEWLLECIAAATNGSRSGSNAVPGTKKITRGKRNDYLTSIAGTMRKRGMCQQAIEAALLAENFHQCDPPLPEAEVRSIASSVASYNPGEKVVGRHLKAAVDSTLFRLTDEGVFYGDSDPENLL